MPKQLMAHAAATGSAAAMIAGLLTGCAGSSPHHPDTALSPTGTDHRTTASAAAGALPPGVTGATDVPTDVANKTALRKNVTMSTCKKTPHGWSAGGRVTNPRKKAATYTITIFFTTSSATVTSTGSTSVTVPPSGTRKWTVNRTFTATPKTLCVLRGVG